MLSLTNGGSEKMELYQCLSTGDTHISHTAAHTPSQQQHLCCSPLTALYFSLSPHSRQHATYAQLDGWWHPTLPCMHLTPTTLQIHHHTAHTNT